MSDLLRTVCAASVAAASVAATAVADSLTPPERAIVAHVESRQERALALLERTVNRNSGTMNFDGVRAVGRVFDAELAALGFATRWVDGKPFGRAGHLVAERAGDPSDGDRPRLLLIGHLDTVFELTSPFQAFERTDADVARGPGIVDMKGGNVVIVEALAALASVGALDSLHLTVVLTGDEEKPGAPLALARAALVEAAQAADVALAFENADNRPETAVVARRGATSWRLTVTGRPAHSSQVFSGDVGAGAAYEAARILTEFYDELAGERFLTFNPGVMLAGTEVEFDPAAAHGSAFGKNNVVAEHAVVAGDIRTISPAQLAAAKERMRHIVAHSLPHTTAELTFDDGYPPMAPTDGNRRLLARLDAVSRDLGAGPVTEVDPRRAGAADVSFTAGLVDMALDGLGLVGAHDHTEDELADLSTLPLQTKRAALLLYRLGRDGL